MRGSLRTLACLANAQPHLVRLGRSSGHPLREGRALTPHQREVPEAFDREQGCTEADWERSLPGAVGPNRLHRPGAGSATVDLGHGGRLHLSWAPMPPRQIALVRMPRLAVRFRFDGAGAAARAEFMRYFDLYMQRGGG